LITHTTYTPTDKVPGKSYLGIFKFNNTILLLPGLTTTFCLGVFANSLILYLLVKSLPLLKLLYSIVPLSLVTASPTLTKKVNFCLLFKLAILTLIGTVLDRKSTRLNSSHVSISYA